MEKLKVLSSTLAEIYIRQGHLEKAREVYEKLIARESANSFYRSRLALLLLDTPGKKRLRILTHLLKRLEEKRDERDSL